MKRTGKQTGFMHLIWLCMIVLPVIICMNGILAYGAEEQDSEDWIKTVYNEDNGLPTGEANVVIQTQDGYIWIGSYGGLIRYDGTNFKNYSEEDNTLESSSIRALHEGMDGKLYIGTNDKGVYVYENGNFTKAPYNGEDDAFYSVRSFTETSDGTIYVGTTSGLAMIQPEKSAELFAVSDTQGHIIYDLTSDRNDAVWACSDNGEILVIQEDTVVMQTDSAPFMENDCYSVLAASDDCVYLGSSGNEIARLMMTDSKYQISSFSVRIIKTGTIHTMNKLYEDTDKNIWVLADNGMGFVNEKGEFDIPSVMKDLSSVSYMIQDYEGNLWTASTKTGVGYFSHGKYFNINRGNDLAGTAVNVIERYEDNTYIGTDYGLIILDKKNKQIRNELTEMLESKRVRHITCEDTGTIWFSLYGDGLAKYIPKENQIKIFTEEDGLLSNQVRSTLVLQDGSLAIAGSSGIDIMKNDKVVRSYGADVLPYPFILCMYQAEDGTLIAGSDGMGIYAIKEDTVKQYYEEEGLDSGVVMRMAVDPEQNGVWVSAGNALYFWDETGIRKLSFHHGAGSVLDIQMIGSELWLMKSNGPVIVDKADLLEETGEGKELSKEYGLTGTLVANSWNYLSEDGYLWLCTNNGVSIINTADIPVNSAAPKGAVTQITADDQIYMNPTKIEVPASTKRITLDLAVMSYTPADKYVEYYLEGFDDKMIRCNISEMPNISYTNLNGGDYVFHVTVYNEDGVKGDSYRITIHKKYHFRELGWFWILMVLVLIAVIAGIFRCVYRVKIANLKKRQTEYRSIIEQSLHTFANAIDAKDKDTNGHSGRVAFYSKEIARRMNLPEEEQENIYYMALLHDIGKIGIPDSILKKNGKLTKEEWEIVKSHPRIGGEILKEFTAIPGIADGAKYHHEFYNGKGYCEGLKGDEIPLKARIIAVADAFDAMCSKRYYHDGTTVEHAREEIQRCMGEQFDPDAAKCMIDMIDDDFIERNAAE